MKLVHNFGFNQGGLGLSFLVVKEFRVTHVAVMGFLINKGILRVLYKRINVSVNLEDFSLMVRDIELIFICEGIV